MKLDVHYFDGKDPSGWIFKINQFFEYHDTPAHERLTIASFYKESKVLTWFQWMTSNGQLTSWPVFLQALQTRFAPSQYEDPTGALFKLTQKGTVSAYLSEFEELANHVIGLPAPFLLRCFISGLSPDIRREVQALQPLTISQAAGLARLQEDKILDTRPSPRPRPPFLSTQPSFRNPPPSPKPSTPSITHPPSVPLLSLPPRPPPPTMKRLSPDEIASMHERGLYFTCDEKYHRGHRCASRVFLFLAEGEDPSDADIEPPNPQPESPNPISPHTPSILTDPVQAQISLNSLACHVVPETLRFVLRLRWKFS